ncbi:hypothetical protein IHV09_08700 [Fictibacillus sp. 23RED33]|uniref:hypothetical protein n=1 Tax=Fictibacillus sp. 23RED33 TaxID=2745879 RepID=UPI0018CE8122|nr:hypothetical protein [Fictibacillus sp. 23RED33]MBH0173634.1 hypothetical protein [Fictibacillus sp. 23RED33]
MRAGNIYQFKSMSKFQSVGEFNQHKDLFLQQNPELFTKSEYIAFEVLSQYSVVVPGVANAKIATLVAACSKKQGGISRATFTRMLRKARSTGFLKVHNTYRTSGGLAHNIFVFHPIDAPTETKLIHRDTSQNRSQRKVETTKTKPESINLLPNLKNKDQNIRQENNVTITTPPPSNKPQLQDLDHTFVPSNVPLDFIQSVKPYYDRANEIYTFWHKAIIAYKKFNFRTPIEQLISIIIEAFKTTVFLYKKRKIKTSFTQYFYGTLSGMFSAEKRREHAAYNPRPHYNWLNQG